MPLLSQEPVVVKEEQENPRESWGQGASKQMYSKCQRVDTHSGESGQSSTHPAPDQETPENGRLTHKQEQQEACGQWDEDSIGTGQEVLVDDMLAVDEWLAPRARALVSTARLTQPEQEASPPPLSKGLDLS